MRISIQSHSIKLPTPLEVGCLKTEVVNVVCQVQAHAHKMCTVHAWQRSKSVQGRSQGGARGARAPPTSLSQVYNHREMYLVMLSTPSLPDLAAVRLLAI